MNEHNESHDSRDIDMDQTVSDVNNTTPRPSTSDATEQSSQQQYNQTKVANIPPRSSSQPAIFRPYDHTDSGDTLQTTPNNLPPGSDRISRPLERGSRRPSSKSTSRSTSKANKTGNTGSKNSKSRAKKDNNTGQSISRTPTPVTDKNSNTSASDPKAVIAD